MNPKIASYIATFFGIGLVKKFPGSFASLAAALIWYFTIIYLNLIAILFINIAIFFIAYYSISEYQKTTDSSDPQEIVIDEVAGMSIAALGASLYFSATYFLLAFIIFRVLDFFKPSIIYKFEIDKKDSSILMDDVLSGLFALLIMLALGSSDIV